MKTVKTSTKRVSISPEPFEYLGKTFIPIDTGKHDWKKLSNKIWGGGDYLKPLDAINKNGYTHSDFYKVAKEHGCGKIDVFEMDGEKVIPCNALMYYGEPTWYAPKRNQELSEATFRRYQEQYLKEAIRDIETALEQKLQKAFNSGAIPEVWKETGNHLTMMAVIDSFCKERPYKMWDKEHQKEADNLHLFI